MIEFSPPPIRRIFLGIFWILTNFSSEVIGGCYFPLEFQGEFLTQSLASREIAYSSMSVLFDSIPSWGRCHRRLGHHVILNDGDESHSSCFRCISMVSRSPNVLQIHFNDGVTPSSKCHASEEDALAACPTARQIRERRASEMMFYKTRSFYGGSAVTKTYCPLNGRFKFTYSINDGTEDDLECHEPLSEATDCPTGYKFDLHFKGCSFPDFDMSFQCLASWPGQNGENYLSLLDTKLPQLGEEPRPRYRCALYKEDPDTGLIHVALSSDSTCTHHLYSAQDGYETMHLEKVDNEVADDAASTEDEPLCIFPDWMQGEWEGLTVSGGEMVYRDEANFVTYRGRCQMMASPDRFVVKLGTDCGAASHYCALFKQRDVNVMEFQLGLSNDPESGDPSLCDVSNFSPSKWLTLGRSSISDAPHCPLVGEYSGVLPDAEGLCAKSYADCNNPEVMFYTVYNCDNRSEIYEEREYRCFGQWEENGLVYTYTERRDIPGNECFVGVTLSDDENMVTEAGANCERGHQPDKYGMTLRREAGSCTVNNNNAVKASTRDNLSEKKRIPSEINRELAQQEKDLRIVTKGQKRPISPKFGGGEIIKVDVDRDQDLFSNEIPGSSNRRSVHPSAGSSSAIKSSSILLFLAMSVLMTLNVLS